MELATSRLLTNTLTLRKQVPQLNESAYGRRNTLQIYQSFLQILSCSPRTSVRAVQGLRRRGSPQDRYHKNSSSNKYMARLRSASGHEMISAHLWVIVQETHFAQWKISVQAQTNLLPGFDARSASISVAEAGTDLLSYFVLGLIGLKLMVGALWHTVNVMIRR